MGRAIAPHERQREIVGFLPDRGFVSVEELCRHFAVSEMTIRRDLAELDKQGLLQRTYGGATLNEKSFFEISFKAKITQYVEEKERIGRAAAVLVHDGDTVLLDAGTTTTQVARHLRDRRLTVVTPALNIASDLLHCPNIDLLMPGSLLQRGPVALIGPQAVTFLEGIRADILFLAVEGVDARGLTVPDVVEAHSKTAMVRSARRIVVVADHSKLGRSALTVICPLTRAECLITGIEAPADVVEPLQDLTKVVQV